MNPRHGTPHSFTEKYYPGFGRLSQPILYVHLRSPDARAWSLEISALVDTGASITLVMDKYLGQIPGFDRALLGAELKYSSATGPGTCRGALLDVLLGPATDSKSFMLPRRPVYFTSDNLPAPILLGQRGVLDSVRLSHSNCGPRRCFRFMDPQVTGS